MDYITYIKENIFPIYSKNDKGHNMEHINQVISRSLEFSKSYNVDDKLCYIAAAYHDLGHHIDKDTHEKISSDMFLSDEFMREFFKFIRNQNSF